MAKRREERIVEDIKRYFGFLFDKGYHIRDVRYFPESFGNWYVILECPRYCLRIDYDRSYISILFDPEKANGRHQFGLESLIYYLSTGKHFVGYFEGNPAWERKKQFERLADLLKQYHDQIASLFVSDFYRLREDLTASQKKYGEVLSKNYSQKFKAEQKSHARLILLLSPIAFLLIAPLAYLAWGMSINFVAETNISSKLTYGFIGLVLIIILAVSLNRMIKSVARYYRILKE